MATVGTEADVSVIIVSYNTRVALLKCLKAIDPACEVIVVDNASADGSAEAVRSFPHVVLIENRENRGFGAANNQGMAVATRPLVLFLNSDSTPTAGSIGLLAAVFGSEEIIAAGGKLLFSDGSLQNSCANELTLWAVLCEQLWLEKLFKNSKTFSHYWTTQSLADSTAPTRVHQVMGACLMTRSRERFDECFFMYCEDTDLCERLGRQGQIVYVPLAEFFHELGTSSKGMRWKAVAMYNCGKELYFRIHHGPFSAFVCYLFDRLGALLRLIAWFGFTVASAGTNRKAQANAGEFWKVLWAPRSYKGLLRR